MKFVFTLMLILLFTKLVGHISTKIGQPAVLGKLIVGIIFGTALLGWIQVSPMITQFSDIGVLLLMFIAGLETDLKRFCCKVF